MPHDPAAPTPPAALPAAAAEESKRWTLLCMSVMGSANIVPWLSYITAVDYFETVYPASWGIEFYLAVVNMGVLVVGTVFMMEVGRHWPLHARVLLSTVALMAALLAVPVLDLFRDELSQLAMFRLTLLSLLLCCVFTSVCQASMYGLGGLMGGEFVNVLESGKGASGVLIVGIRLLTKAAFGGDEQQSMYWFFAVSELVLAASLACYLAMMYRLEFSRGVFATYERLAEEEEELVHEHDEHPAATEETGLLRRGAPSVQAVVKHHHHPDHEAPSVRHVWGRVWSLALTVCFVFVACLACFPGMTTSLESHQLGLGDWFPIVLIAVYNASDLVGKVLPGYVQPFTPASLPWALAGNLSFIPLFVLGLHPAVWPAVLDSDLYPLLLVMGLGVCTGFIGCSAMMFAPARVEEHEREVAGQLMSLFLISGLAGGSFVGLGLEKLGWV